MLVVYRPPGDFVGANPGAMPGESSQAMPREGFQQRRPPLPGGGSGSATHLVADSHRARVNGSVTGQ